MPTSLPKVTSLAESTSPPTELTALKPKVLRSPLSAMLIPTKGPTAMQSPLRLLSALQHLRSCRRLRAISAQSPEQPMPVKLASEEKQPELQKVT